MATTEVLGTFVMVFHNFYHFLFHNHCIIYLYLKQLNYLVDLNVLCLWT